MNSFGKIWIQNMGDVDFKVISAAENSNKFWKKQVLEEKINWEHGNTWRLTIQFKHIFHSYLAIEKIIHTLPNNVHMLSFSIL